MCWGEKSKKMFEKWHSQLPERVIFLLTNSYVSKGVVKKVPINHLKKLKKSDEIEAAILEQMVKIENKNIIENILGIVMTTLLIFAVLVWVGMLIVFTMDDYSKNPNSLFINIPIIIIVHLWIYIEIKYTHI